MSEWTGRSIRQQRVKELSMPCLGVYISVPFCTAKCTFCNFASVASGLGRLDEYVNRVCAEIRAARSRSETMGTELPRTIDSIYLGGGTPSLLAPMHLRSLFETLRGEFELEPDAEITMECAPGQLTDATLCEATRQGINRVSLGVQSFVDSESAAVGRLHTAKQCMAEIARLRSAKLDEISVDLIAGLPGQSCSSWSTSVRAVIESGVPHASVYMLEVDEESRLGKELIAGGPRYQASSVPSDEAMTKFYLQACESFNAAGLRQYEISNFAFSGHQSRHNLKYWRREPYLGFGLDAHSMLGRGTAAVRFANADRLNAYLAGSDGEITDVDEDAGFEEALFLGLRMNAGLDRGALAREFGSRRVRAVSGIIDQLVLAGLLHRIDEQVLMTDSGRLVSNEVFAELLNAELAPA